ncbi:hypothetical protein [Mesorhizobium sp. M1252]|uniref:hypothetical protein n=1 Tax=Mesorhizobium sp. M1252 TaxID=2957073 RepID=UPI0033359C9F
MGGRIYGQAPRDCGLVDLQPTEMMFWQDLFIKPAKQFEPVLPANLQQFGPLIAAVMRAEGIDRWIDHNVFMCAKTLWVSAAESMNRRGWHTDGFMSSDINYVWSDCYGTEIWLADELVSLTQDHAASIDEMTFLAADPFYGSIVTYPDRHLIRLDETVVHRVAEYPVARMRSFVKVSLSKGYFNRVGNSINHQLPLPVAYEARTAERNVPASKEAA